MSFQPVTRWVLRCDGDTTRGQCDEQLRWTYYDEEDGDDPEQPLRRLVVLDTPAFPAEWQRPLRDEGWLWARDGRVLCARHVAALEYLAHAELDGLPFPTAATDFGAGEPGAGDSGADVYERPSRDLP